MSYALRSVGLTFGDGHVLHEHDHPWGQLIFASAGTMRVKAEEAWWLVPPGRALWAPPGTRHEIEARGTLAMRTVYVPPAPSAEIGGRCRAIEVGPLLRELILAIVARGLVPEDTDAHLAGLFLAELACAPALALRVPMPRDPRLLRIAEQMSADPCDDAGLEALSRRANASQRTVQRLFRRDTGMRFVEWRQRLRLVHAVARLTEGASVTEAGAEAGYSSTSAFIAAFRQLIGTTPKRYLDSAAPPGNSALGGSGKRVTNRAASARSPST
jgi:AraC-like DNA-binding protein